MEPNLKPAGTAYKQILLGKLSLAVVSSLLFQSAVLLVYIFARGFSLTGPVSSTARFFATLLQPSTWFYLVPFLGIVFAQGVICSKDYIVNAEYCSTRFRRLVSVFSVRNVVLLGLHIVAGFSTVWLYLALGDGGSYSRLVRVEDGKGYFSEDVFYLLLGGGWTGLYYFLKVHAGDKRVLFPVAHQRKWLRFKGSLVGILRESNDAALWPAVHLTYTYFFFGGSIAEWLARNLNCELERGGNCLLVYLASWFFSTLIYFHTNVMVFFYELFLTEPLEFPIDSDTVSLKEAVRFNVPIIQHLACLDFFLLTGNSRARRELLFSLSQPGGHPHNWNNLIENVLRTINEYTETLNKSTNTLLAPEKPKPLMTTQETARLINYDKLRPLSEPNTTLSNHPPTPRRLPFQDKLDSLLLTVKHRSGFNFVFSELPEAGIQKSLADGQTIIWITQALACIASASIKEDRYGIVQKDLPVILSTLVELKSSVERLNRIPALNRKGHGLDDFNTKMKAGVGNAIKRSLFQLCANFGPYLKDLNLKKEVATQLHAFVPVKCGYY